MSLRFSPIAVTDAATYAVKEYNSGVLHALPNFTATCTITLPTAKKGLSYEFMYSGAAADAQNAIISTGATANPFKGGVVFMDQDTDVMAPVYANGSSHYILTMVTPEVGTTIKVVCDGTNWYLNGNVFSATTPTIT